MRDRARLGLVAAGAMAAVALVAVGADLVPDRVGAQVVEACEARVIEARAGATIMASQDARSPAMPDERGPSGPAGDTLHEVSVRYADEAGPGVARCTYLERAADGGFDPAAVRIEGAAARP